MVNIHELIQFAKEQTRDEYQQHVHHGDATATSVCVITASWSEHTYPRCDLSMFEHDTLTVTATDDGRVLRVYKPGAWRRGTEYDSRAYPLHWFVSEMEADRIVGEVQQHERGA